MGLAEFECLQVFVYLTATGLSAECSAENVVLTLW
jgi:hypothetical protein